MAADTVPGRIIVTGRAHERLLATLADDALGVVRGSARARISDDAGRIAVKIASPGDVTPGSPALLDRVQDARRRIAEEGARLTGAQYSGIDIRITRTVIDQRRVA